MISAHNILADIIEDDDKNITKCLRCTDTETETDIVNSNLKFQEIMSKKQIKQKNIKSKHNANKNKLRNVFEEFIDDLASYEYDQHQIRKNQMKKKRMERNKENKQMNLIDTNNNRFLNYYEAFLYIGEHCVKHDQKFTRETCKQYLKQCYIIDFAHDNFIPITTHLTQKLFNKYFRLIQRELKFI